jgi:thiosulfate/3-mercaptopyruvate sulfurtransferase
MNEIIGERKLDNVARGGHVPGSSFIEWKQVTDFKNKLSFPHNMRTVERKLKKLGITKDKKIYTYCHVGAGRGSYFYTVLKLLGYKHVKVYTGSWDEWGNDQNLPIRK